MLLTMGMFENTQLERLSSHCPTMLVTATPVSHKAVTRMMTLRPGTRCKSASTGWMLTGSTVRATTMNQANTSSSVPIPLLSTQMVITRGSQTSRPVRMYFFTLGRGERARGRVPWQAAWPVLSGQAVSGECVKQKRRSVAGAGAAAWSAARVAACAAGLGRRRSSCCRGGACGLGTGAARAATEVGHIPARTLELEACSRDLLLEALGAAGGAGGEHRIRDFLQNILGVTAGRALVGINRHGLTSRKSMIVKDGRRPCQRACAGKGPRKEMWAPR